MTGTEWILIDTETSGLIAPVACVELAAQRMSGVTAMGEPFRALLNHDVEIDAMAESIHGYSRAYLRQHGRDPRTVHGEFMHYAGDRPIVAFNLGFDWKRVLAPELARLGLTPTYRPGFCALTLARRCIHETAGHGLQRLRAHFFPYHRGVAHRAQDDVAITCRILVEVIWPRLERAGLNSFEEVAKFSRLTPIAACHQRLRSTATPETSEAKMTSAYAVDGESELRQLVQRILIQGALAMEEIDSLRDWLARRRELQSELARSCRGLVEIAFGENQLEREELRELCARLGRLVRENAA